MAPPVYNSDGFSVYPILDSEQRDIIQCMAYNYYGTRLAVCSSDQTVTISEYNRETKEWTRSSTWRMHCGPIWKVCWADPEFGQVLAACSFDRSITVWEEMSAISNAASPEPQWCRRAELVENRADVRDIEFGPPHLGIVLASCSQDGVIRLYEARDAMNLSVISPLAEIFVPNKLQLSCLSWNFASVAESYPMLAVGSDDDTHQANKLFVYVCHDAALAAKSNWTRVDTAISCVCAIEDLAWAPSVGTSYSTLAIATQTGIEMYKVEAVHSQSSDSAVSFNFSPLMLVGDKDEPIQPDHIRRVLWNVTGTVMVSVSESGRVNNYRETYMGKWKNVSCLLHSDDPNANGQNAQKLPTNVIVIPSDFQQQTYPNSIGNGGMEFER